MSLKKVQILQVKHKVTLMESKVEKIPENLKMSLKDIVNKFLGKLQIQI